MFEKRKKKKFSYTFFAQSLMVKRNRLDFPHIAFMGKLLNPFLEKVNLVHLIEAAYFRGALK